MHSAEIESEDASWDVTTERLSEDERQRRYERHVERLHEAEAKTNAAQAS